MTEKMTAHIIWNFVFLTVCLTALVRGSLPERVTVGVLLLADLLSGLPLRIGAWKPIEPSLVVIDLGVALFFVVLALRSSRWWPLWASAFQLLAFIMLVITALDPAIRPYAYYVGELIWDYLGLAALFVGTVIEGRRELALPQRHATSNASAR